MKTWSPFENLVGRTGFASCCFFSACGRTGWSRDSRVRNWRPSINSAGVLPVVLWGVLRYSLKSALAAWSFSRPSFTTERCIALLNTPTRRSASPLDDGWNGAEVMCTMPFDRHQFAKSADANWGPLSDTRVFGRPQMVNNASRPAMVISVVG